MLSYAFQMSKWFRVCAIAAASTALMSCTPPPIEIEAKRVGDRQVISLTQDWGLIFRDRKVPCVDEVRLSEAGPKGKVLWRIEARTRQCVDLASFTIGEAPTGFVERTTFQPSRRSLGVLVVIGIGIAEAEMEL